MKLIIGLGNPGARYSGTRHNAGRMLLEKIAEKFFKGKWMFLSRAQASVIDGEWEGERVTLVRPENFMNVSGETVKTLVESFRVQLSDILVLVDDVSLSLGSLRIRPSGSEGGHNGLRSIQSMLGSENYPRLRIGIDPCPSGVPLEEYVLDSFTLKEKKLLTETLDKGVEACRLWLNQPFERVMSAVNASNV